MKIFQLTSSSFTGYIEFIFNDNTLLEGYGIHADLSEKQQVYILKNMPREIIELDKLKSGTVTITEINQEVTFEMFWNRYDEKIRSSKKKALSGWNKMSKANQVRAFRFISKYESNILPDTAKKYAETYLNAELWDN
jgi:hypothetical protein